MPLAVRCDGAEAVRIWHMCIWPESGAPGVAGLMTKSCEPVTPDMCEAALPTVDELTGSRASPNVSSVPGRARLSYWSKNWRWKVDGFPATPELRPLPNSSVLESCGAIASSCITAGELTTCSPQILMPTW